MIQQLGVSRQTLWNRVSQRLEITSGERLPDQPVPLLKRRWELNREEALKLWAAKKGEGWQACPPQWTPPLLQPRDRPGASSMGQPGRPPCS
jgi:hypothetical protein